MRLSSRKAALLLLLLAVAALSLVSLSRVLANGIDSPPEFYFTRLAYGDNGRFGWTMPKPDQQYECWEFGTETYFPEQGWGWGTDYPGADCKFMGGISRLSNINVHKHPNVIGIMDDDLFKYPYVYAVEVGGMFLSNAEAARLREYLLRGGFIHVDDFWGGYEFANFQAQIRKVFPDRPLQQLPLTHEVFHTFFDIDEVMQIPNVGNGCRGGPTWERRDDIMPRIFGVSDDDGRLMVAVTYNSDLGDAWEYMDERCYPAKFSGQAYRMGLNFMIYAMTH
jgi:hypothetical protein